MFVELENSSTSLTITKGMNVSDGVLIERSSYGIEDNLEATNTTYVPGIKIIKNKEGTYVLKRRVPIFYTAFRELGKIILCSAALLALLNLN